MHFLLLVLLALACLPDSKTDWPQPPWDGTAISTLLTGLAVAVTVLLAYRIARQARKATPSFLADEQLTHYEHSRGRHQWLLFAFFAVELVVLGWGHAVGQWQTTYDLPLPELFILAPFLASLLLSWACFYDVERGQVNRAEFLEPPAVVDTVASFAGNPAAALNRPRSRGGRWSYVLFQARQRLALVCVPLGMLLVMKELARRVPQDTWDHWRLPLQFGVVAIVLATLIALPWFVRLALGLVPLPDGALKKRLLDTAHRLRFRCSGFLLWRTRRSMANAMVVGILPWPRYVIFTDRLLEEFTAEEVEAVLGHEIGHIKHGHMPFYLAFLMTSFLIPTIAATIFWAAADDKGNAPAVAATEEFSSALVQPAPKREFFALQPSLPERRPRRRRHGGLRLPGVRLRLAAVRTASRPVRLPCGIVPHAEVRGS